MMPTSNAIPQRLNLPLSALGGGEGLMAGQG